MCLFDILLSTGLSALPIVGNALRKRKIKRINNSLQNGIEQVLSDFGAVGDQVKLKSIIIRTGCQYHCTADHFERINVSEQLVQELIDLYPQLEKMRSLLYARIALIIQTANESIEKILSAEDLILFRQGSLANRGIKQNAQAISQMQKQLSTVRLLSVTEAKEMLSILGKLINEGSILEANKCAEILNNKIPIEMNGIFLVYQIMLNYWLFDDIERSGLFQKWCDLSSHCDSLELLISFFIQIDAKQQIEAMRDLINMEGGSIPKKIVNLFGENDLDLTYKEIVKNQALLPEYNTPMVLWLLGNMFFSNNAFEPANELFSNITDPFHAAYKRLVSRLNAILFIYNNTHHYPDKWQEYRGLTSELKSLKPIYDQTAISIRLKYYRSLLDFAKELTFGEFADYYGCMPNEYKYDVHICIYNG